MVPIYIVEHDQTFNNMQPNSYFLQLDDMSIYPYISLVLIKYKDVNNNDIIVGSATCGLTNPDDTSHYKNINYDNKILSLSFCRMLTAEEMVKNPPPHPMVIYAQKNDFVAVPYKGV